MKNSRRPVSEYVQKLEEATRKYDRAAGQFQEVKKALEERFGVSKLDEAEEVLADVDARIEELEKLREKIITELEANYVWD